MKFDGKYILVKKVQRYLNLKEDGKDGPITWNAIINKLGIPEEVVKQESYGTVSDKALDLIIDHEVGGGESYYNRALKKPTYPGGASGVTIGIGYDLGYNTDAQFTRDWKEYLSENDFNRLSKCLGIKGSSARSKAREVRDISIPWSSALSVFKNSTLPRFINLTLKTFPGSEKLCEDAFGALVSIVFNRGSSLRGSRRIEMLNINKALKGNIKNILNIYDYISSQIIAMKRLWVGKGLDGLLRRRNDEASLVKSCRDHKYSYD